MSTCSILANVHTQLVLYKRADSATTVGLICQSLISEDSSDRLYLAYTIHDWLKERFVFYK